VQEEKSAALPLREIRRHTPTREAAITFWLWWDEPFLQGDDRRRTFLLLTGGGGTRPRRWQFISKNGEVCPKTDYITPGASKRVVIDIPNSPPGGEEKGEAVSKLLPVSEGVHLSIAC